MSSSVSLFWFPLCSLPSISCQRISCCLVGAAVSTSVFPVVF